MMKHFWASKEQQKQAMLELAETKTYRSLLGVESEKTQPFNIVEIVIG